LNGGYCYYQVYDDMGALTTMSSVFLTSDAWDEYHIEIDANVKNLIFDEANDLMEEMCGVIEPVEVISLKYHANSWGLSSNQFFGEETLSKMSKLQKIDFSDTIKFEHRSDLAMSCGAMLDHVTDKNIIQINFAENDLETGGGIGFSRFLEANSTLQILNLKNC
jgi:hypothetical protein